MRTTRAGDRHGEAFPFPYPAPPRPRNAVRRHGDKQRIQDHFFLIVYNTSVDLYERDISPTSASGVVLSLVLSLVPLYMPMARGAASASIVVILSHIRGTQSQNAESSTC